MAAKNKHDIMDDLLKGASEDTPLEAPSLAKLIHRTGETTRATHPGESASDPEQKKAPGPDSKKKSTHYLSEEIFEDLDDARDKINELVHQRLKSRVSKSRIVNQALRMILKDFEEKGEKSHLIKEILKDIRKK
ncbi:hypothetical protein [Thiovibrio frasassiensis]|jgi:hypothetical protein|uniref:Uncharacterized protein n=1 Tax=Thiovibrio frasassiensis TaxID=2984131 RepID=A0A9X4MEL3_9BACT|nr:hypothetical protein [Thiovibrio frasassiensis]MDG4475257.1 hypothetical protein [Thiovibrio frasassiensis]